VFFFLVWGKNKILKVDDGEEEDGFDGCGERWISLYL